METWRPRRWGWWRPGPQKEPQAWLKEVWLRTHSEGTASGNCWWWEVSSTFRNKGHTMASQLLEMANENHSRHRPLGRQGLCPALYTCSHVWSWQHGSVQQPHHRPPNEQGWGGSHPSKRQSPSSAPDPSPQPPPTFTCRPSKSGRGREGFLGSTQRLSHWFLFPKWRPQGISLYLKTYVYLGNWSPVAEEPLQAACRASPQGHSPCPAFLGTRPSHQQLSQGGGKRRPPPALRGAPEAPPPQPCMASWSPLIL